MSKKPTICSINPSFEWTNLIFILKMKMPADLDNEMEVDDPGHNVASPGGEVNGLISSQKSQTAKSKKLTLSQQEYFQMANVIVHYLRQKEDLNEDVHRNDIVNWYIEHVMEEVESQDELVEKKQIVEKVLDR